MASQAPPPGMAPPPLTNQQPVQREAEAPVAAPQQQRQHQGYGRGGGGGRNQGRGRGNNNGRGGGRGRGGGEGRGGGSNGPTSVAPTSGIPYGHVPAYLPGSSSLVEELDTRVLIVLRDGRHIVGIIRSFDQYNNIVLDEATERKIHRHTDGVVYYSDVPMGVYFVRGDSVVLLGQVAPDDGMKNVELAEIEEMIKGSNKEALEWDFDKDLFA